MKSSLPTEARLNKLKEQYPEYFDITGELDVFAVKNDEFKKTNDYDGIPVKLLRYDYYIFGNNVFIDVLNFNDENNNKLELSSLLFNDALNKDLDVIDFSLHFVNKNEVPSWLDELNNNKFSKGFDIGQLVTYYCNNYEYKKLFDNDETLIAKISKNSDLFYGTRHNDGSFSYVVPQKPTFNFNFYIIDQNTIKVMHNDDCYIVFNINWYDFFNIEYFTFNNSYYQTFVKDSSKIYIDFKKYHLDFAEISIGDLDLTDCYSTYDGSCKIIEDKYLIYNNIVFKILGKDK